jgi:hypothetical protein
MLGTPLYESGDGPCARGCRSGKRNANVADNRAIERKPLDSTLDRSTRTNSLAPCLGIWMLLVICRTSLPAKQAFMLRREMLMLDENAGDWLNRLLNVANH